MDNSGSWNGSEGGELMKSLKDIKKLGSKRRREILYMAGALLLIFIGLPFILSTLMNWNDFLPSSPWIEANETSFKVEDYDEGVYPGRIALVDTYPASTNYAKRQTDIIWNETGSDVLAIVQTGEDNSCEYEYLIFTLNYTINELLEAGLNNWYYNITMPNGTYTIMFAVWNAESIYNPTPDDIEPVVSKKFTDNTTGYFNISSMDILMDKVKISATRIGFAIRTEEVGVGDPNDLMLETGDIVFFDFQYRPPGANQVPEMTAMKYGALIIGIILILVGLGSTKWWNPIQKDNPGIIDKLWKKLFNRGKKN